LLAAAVGGGPGSLWSYDSDDAHGDVDETGYFSDGGDRGMQEGDFVLVRKTDTGATTLHSVIDVEAVDPYRPAESGPRAATISSAVLS
jgi:hypothetical protein